MGAGVAQRHFSAVAKVGRQVRGHHWDARRITVSDGVETLGPEVIQGQFLFGSCGTCQGGTLQLADPRWAGRARSHVITTRLESERGTHDMHLGVLDQAERGRGSSLHPVRLLPPLQVYQQAPGWGLIYPPLAVSQEFHGVQPGFSDPITGMPRIIREALEEALDPHPSADAGVRADRVAIVGLPEHSGPVDYALDSRAYDLAILGLTIPPYLTDLTWDWGDGWPRQHEQVRAVTATLERRHQHVRLPEPLEQVFGTPGWTFLDNNYWAYMGPIAYPPVLPQAIYADGVSRSVNGHGGGVFRPAYGSPWGSRQRSAALRASVTLSGIPEGETANVQLFLRDDAGHAQQYASQVMQVPATSNGLTYTADFALSADVIAAKPTLNLLVAIRGPEGTHAALSLGGVVESERPRPILTTDYPPGVYAPTAVGPVREFRLPGVHVPPFRVLFPDGTNQMAAGAVVDWAAENVSTLIRTAAWPYPGQRRSG